MTMVSLLKGMAYPQIPINGGTFGTIGTIDAATEKVAMLGRIMIAGRATGKVLSAAGGGSILWRAGATTFANGSTTVQIGLQDVDLTTGNPVRPDGTFDVSRVLTGGVDTISASALNTHAMTGGSGSKTINHGDWVALVIDMTARAGADSVIVQGIQFGGSNLPACLTNLAGVWAGVSSMNPQMGIIFDDGTFGMIDTTIPPLTSLSLETWNNSSNPDERGNLITFPWDVKVDAIEGYFAPNHLGADAELQIYSDPFGTPTSVLPGGTPITLNAEMLRAIGSQILSWQMASEISLSKNTPYVLAIKVNGGTDNFQIANTMTFPHVGWKEFLYGAYDASKCTRNAGSGVFTESDTLLYQLSLRVSGHDDGTGAGGGGGGGASFNGFVM